MSCGDCDWGCIVGDCGKKVSVCQEHYESLRTRIDLLEKTLAGVHDLMVHGAQGLADVVNPRVVNSKPKRNGGRTGRATTTATTDATERPEAASTAEPKP